MQAVSFEKIQHKNLQFFSCQIHAKIHAKSMPGFLGVFSGVENEGRNRGPWGRGGNIHTILAFFMPPILGKRGPFLGRVVSCYFWMPLTLGTGMTCLGRVCLGPLLFAFINSLYIISISVAILA